MYFDGIDDEALGQARAEDLLSMEHFSFDGILVSAWASQKSFVPKEGPLPPSSGSKSKPEVDFPGASHTNDTHGSGIEPDCRRYRNSNNAEAIPCYMRHVLIENRNGQAVDHRLGLATGGAEHEVALDLLAAQPGERRKSVGAGTVYDTADFVEGCRHIGLTPHVAQNTKGRRSVIDRRTTRHPAYEISQVTRKLIVTIFGDAKQRGTLRQFKLRGLDKARTVFRLVLTAVNLPRPTAFLSGKG